MAYGSQFLLSSFNHLWKVYIMQNLLDQVFLFLMKYFFMQPYHEVFLMANIYWVAFAYGIFVSFVFYTMKSKNIIVNFIQRLGFGIGILYWGLSTYLLYISLPEVINDYGRKLQAYRREQFTEHVLFELLTLFVIGLVSSVALSIILKRKYGTTLQGIIARFTKTNFNSTMSTEQLAKEMNKVQPKEYNPVSYFRIDKKQVFLNWDAEKRQPVYEDYSIFSKKHAQFSGRSQSGKNLGIQPLAIQMMMFGELVIMLDVKNGGDDIMAPLLYKAANELQQPYTYMEFGVSTSFQFNILQTKDVDTLQEIILQLCNIQETSDMATDYYQKQAKKIALSLAQFVANEEQEITIRDLMTIHYDKFFNPSAKDNEKSKIETSLQILADWDCINAKSAISIDELIANSGVWYIQSKTKEAYPIIQALISVLLKLPNRKRKVCLIADEFFKYVNKDLIEVFTEGGGKGIHCLVAYQTAALLKAPQLNITSEDMIGTLFANCSYSYIYGSNDPFIIKQLEKVGGTVKVSVETQHTERGLTLVDKGTGNKSYREQDVPKITNDMLNLLRDRECFLVCAGRPTNRAHTGIIQILPGKFDKDSSEFKSLSATARRVDEIKQSTENQVSFTNEASSAISNPFA